MPRFAAMCLTTLTWRDDRPEEDSAVAIHLRGQAETLREIFRNPFRPALAIDPEWLAWRGGTVVRLARSAYGDRRLPEGSLVAGRLAVLADALEDAGCSDAELLGHLRGPGPHVRGCWALDLILSKDR
jgi:hypothetical protein